MEAPFQVAELDHVVLRCADMSSMLAFYTQVLGLREERRIEQIGLIQLRAGASLIDLVPASAKRSDNNVNIDHFCLGITTGNLYATVNYLREKGVAIGDEPATRYGAHGMGLSIYIRDPEGNVIELKQMPSEASAG